MAHGKNLILNFRFRDTFFPIKPETDESPVTKVAPFPQCLLVVVTSSSSFLWDFVNYFTFFSLSLALGKSI